MVVLLKLSLPNRWLTKDLGIRELVGYRRVQVKGVGAKMEWARGGNSVELLLSLIHI